MTPDREFELSANLEMGDAGRPTVLLSADIVKKFEELVKQTPAAERKIPQTMLNSLRRDELYHTKRALDDMLGIQLNQESKKAIDAKHDALSLYFSYFGKKLTELNRDVPWLDSKTKEVASFTAYEEFKLIALADGLRQVLGYDTIAEPTLAATVREELNTLPQAQRLELEELAKDPQKLNLAIAQLEQRAKAA